MLRSEIVNPDVGNFLESLRDLGYTAEIAVADLIDNSISASASQIEIYAVREPELLVALYDNGIGMTETELVEAMRLASKSPAVARAQSDLGRFGLGLKTSSFSQCRRLTVITKKQDSVNARQWDLDYIANKNSWLLITPDRTDHYPLFEKLMGCSSGTLVIWELVDRVQASDLSSRIDKIRSHLSLVFHRFLEGSVQGKKLVITVNGLKLCPFNPFNSSHPATQQLADEKINIFNSAVLVQPFILPHHSKISKQEYDQYATEEGYIKSQGFYLYRGQRILVYGTWWGLHKSTDAHKLVRIRIEIPNTMDHHWGIDVKKSTASPSYQIKSDLLRIIDQVTEKGSRPYVVRGKKIEDRTITQFWEIRAVSSKLLFALNQNHPLFTALIATLDRQQTENLQYYLKGIQAYLPLEAIQSQLQRDPQQISQQEALTEEEIYTLAETLRQANVSQEYIEELLKTEPFKNRKHILYNER